MKASDVMIVLSIDGREFNSLPILKYNISAEILDGAGTGRTQSVGWEMFRDPQGVIKNVDGEIGLSENSSDNNDFIDLLAVFDGFGINDFRTVSFITPSGIITQEMYGASYKLSLERVTRDGVSYWGTLQFKFIAKKAIIT